MIEKMLINGARKAMLDNINALNKTMLQQELKEHLIKEFELQDKLKQIEKETKENNEYLEFAKEMYVECDNEDVKIHTIQLINNNLVQNDKLLDIVGGKNDNNKNN